MPGLELEPLGIKTNTVSEMLQILNEFTHSNHSMPKMLASPNTLLRSPLKEQTYKLLFILKITIDTGFPFSRVSF